MVSDLAATLMLMRFRPLAIALVVIAVTVAGCGPTGPGDPGGDTADPVYLLSVLPTPNGLVDTQRQRKASAPQLVDALLGNADPLIAERVDASGVQDAAVRRWSGPDAGTMVASVSVWRGHSVASNVAVVVGQSQLGGAGVSAWTPREVPGSAGTRSTVGQRVRVLTRAIGPNVFVVRATGGVSDRDAIRALDRLIVLQTGSDG